jgi:hypothetical protein
MKVWTLTVEVPIKKFNTFNDFVTKLGKGLPKYRPLEGGSMEFARYIFCIDHKVDIKTLLNEYGYEFAYLRETEIRDEEYNDCHEILPIHGINSGNYFMNKIR